MKTDVQGNRHEELTDMTETAEQRSNTHGFLALIFRTEITENMLKQIKDPAFYSALSEMGATFEDNFLQRPEAELIEALAIEYARLFIGPGQHISPHESVHHKRDDGDWGQFWGADTVAVKKFIESAGLEYKTEYAGLPDHISVELEFMSEVIKREAGAWKDNDREGALYCLKIEKKFMEEHLAGWVPEFCDKIIGEAELSFYREIAKLTRCFLENESKEIDNYLMQTQG